MLFPSFFFLFHILTWGIFSFLCCCKEQNIFYMFKILRNFGTSTRVLMSVVFACISSSNQYCIFISIPFQEASFDFADLKKKENNLSIQYHDINYLSYWDTEEHGQWYLVGYKNVCSIIVSFTEKIKRTKLFLIFTSSLVTWH